MNYLAHLFLSQGNKELALGNFIGDAVKGKKYENYSTGIANGVVHHRFIDRFSDSHPLQLECKRLFYPYFSHYSSIVIDIINDHILATTWTKYSNQSLRTFADEQYLLIEPELNFLPEKSRKFYNYMVKYDLLFNYADLQTIEIVLEKFSRRIKSKVPLEKGVQVYLNNMEEISSKFDLFFF